MQLEKCLVKMIIPEEFRHQLKKKTKYSEDIIYLILDKITKRVGGNIVIKGAELPLLTLKMYQQDGVNQMNISILRVIVKINSVNLSVATHLMRQLISPMRMMMDVVELPKLI